MKYIILTTLLTINVFLVQSQTAEDVTIESSDGYQLTARLYLSGQRSPGIILLHQCNRKGINTGYVSLAALLSEAGFQVLELDFRGYGKSVKKENQGLSTLSSLFPEDVEAAYQFFISKERVASETIGIVGASCGASQAIFLAKKHQSIKALAFLSGSMWKGAKEAFIDINNRPLFIATAEDDKVTKAMLELFSESKNPNSRLHLYKGDLHGTPLFDIDETLQERIIVWFNEVIK